MQEDASDWIIYFEHVSRALNIHQSFSAKKTFADTKVINFLTLFFLGSHSAAK